jgi:hypothetical protein
MEFGPTNGEQMLAWAEREARWEIIRRRLYLALAAIAVVALVVVAIKM